MLAQCFLCMPFTSVDPGSNPTSDRSLACRLCFQSFLDCMGFPPLGVFLSHLRTLSRYYSSCNRPIHEAPPHCVLTNHNATKVRQIRSDMCEHILAHAAELCRKALESPTISCSHVRRRRSLMDRSIGTKLCCWMCNE